MFSTVTKIASEVAGRADNCSVYFGRASIQSQSTFLTFLLPDEEPQILLKSTKGEYIFTDCAIVWCYGESAAGRKREINRLDYREHKIDSVIFETAGIGDWDCQLNVSFGGTLFSIDIKKEEQEAGVKAYRILTGLSAVQESEGRYYTLASTAFQGALSSSLTSDPGVLSSLTDVVMQGAEKIANRYMRRSYKDVFAQYGAN